MPSKPTVLVVYDSGIGSHLACASHQSLRDNLAWKQPGSCCIVATTLVVALYRCCCFNYRLLRIAVLLRSRPKAVPSLYFIRERDIFAYLIKSLRSYVRKPQARLVRSHSFTAVVRKPKGDIIYRQPEPARTNVVTVIL